MVYVGIGEFPLLARMGQETLHDETLVELGVGVAVEIDPSGTVHLLVVGVNVIDESGNAIDDALFRGEILVDPSGLL